MITSQNHNTKTIRKQIENPNTSCNNCNNILAVTNARTGTGKGKFNIEVPLDLKL